MAAKPKVEHGEKRQAADHNDPVVKKRKRYEERPERASRREERREVMAQAKATWEELRPKATSKDKCIKLVSELLKLLSGRIAEFVFRHDGSRIVQWMLSDGNQAQKTSVFDELMEGSKKPVMEGESPFFVRLACDRYGHHLAFKLLRVANKENKKLIFERYLRGNTSELIRNSHGADVLDFAFQTVLNGVSRSELVIELLYSREKMLLDTIRSKLFPKDEPVKPNLPTQTRWIFAESLELVDETFAKVVVESAGGVLNQLIDKENLLRFEIVHSALKEYFHVVLESYPKEKAQDLAVLLAPVLVHFGHTKSGVTVAANCIKILDAKHRKKVIRSLKTHVRKLLEDEYGHRLILALFEWVDDTRLVGKTVTTEIFSDSSLAAEIGGMGEGSKSSSRGGKKKAEKKGKVKMDIEKPSGEDMDIDYVKKMCLHKYARMLFLNLFFGRITRYFNPDMYGLIWADINTEKFGVLSKKDADVRRSELRIMFNPAINAVMKGHLVELLKSHWSAPVVLGALLEKETCVAVTEALRDSLRDEGSFQELVSDTCARKTIATMFKLGGRDCARAILDADESDVIEKLKKAQGCGVLVQNLLAANGNEAPEVSGTGIADEKEGSEGSRKGVEEGRVGKVEKRKSARKGKKTRKSEAR